MNEIDRLTCLVVDDEEAIRDYVTAILETNHFQTLQASNGFEALRLLESLGDTIDLLISDIDMPGGDGVTLFRSARELFPAVPVVLMSGHQVFTIIKSLNVAFQFLRKPFTPSELLTSVQEATGRKPERASNEFDEVAVGLRGEGTSRTPIWRATADIDITAFTKALDKRRIPANAILHRVKTGKEHEGLSHRKNRAGHR
jgi:DNA-binding NtrC family response regulator